jgi:hypothetical protein
MMKLNSARTGNVCIVYLNIFEIAKQFIKEERTGNWGLN